MSHQARLSQQLPGQMFDLCCQAYYAPISCLLGNAKSLIAISCMQELVKQLVIQQQRFRSKVQSLWLQFIIKLI